MAATISEPFTLSSYGISKSPAKRVAGLNINAPHLWSTNQKPSKNSDGHATVTAQGDGVHVIDITTSHPVVSQTLGPSTFFSCPSISQTTPEHGTLTYAVIESASDVDASESGRTIWLWKPDGEVRKKYSTVVSHAVTKMYLLDGIPSRLVLLSPLGDVTLLDGDLTFKSTLQSENQNQTLYQSFIFGRKSCTFVPHRAGSSSGAIVLSVLAAEETLHLQVTSVGEDDAIIKLGECTLSIGQDRKHNAVASLTCSESGYLTVLTCSGAWDSFQLDCTDSAVTALPVSESLHLSSLSAFLPSKKPSQEISLLSLGSSFVLLAGLTKTSPREVIFLLWDLQYSVLLASHTMPVPSTLVQAEKSGLILELAGTEGASTQATLVLTPAVPPKNASKSGDTSAALRSTVLVVPYTLPATSTIAGAMGQASASSKWLAKQSPKDVTSDLGTGSGIDKTQAALLRTMRTSVEQNRPEAASTAFFEWVEKQVHSEDAALKTQGKPHLGDQFVRALLDVVLQPSKGGDVPYSGKVTRWLLEQRAVSAEMVEGGLISALKQRGDWASILLAFETVLDISENDAISLIHSGIAHHRGASAADDAMQVDPVSSDPVPSFPALLFTCVSYATSPAPLRLALRQHIPAAEDIMAVLEVLDGWITEWNTVALKLVPSTVVKNPKGVTIAKPNRIVKAGVPPLHLVIAFLQSLLDASFLTLLQHPPAHPIIRRIHSDIEPELSRVEEMEQLRGPLEPFARAQMKALRESVEGKKDNGQADWRKKRRVAHAQAGMNVGLYRLEELVL